MALVLAEEFRAAGHDVETWFVYRKADDLPGSPGLRVVLPERPSAWDYPRVVRALAAGMRAFGAEALITHMPLTGVLAHAVATAGGVRRRLAIQHNPVDSYGRASQALDLLAGLSGLYTHNVAVSRAVARSTAHYPGRYRRMLEVIPNGVRAPVSPPEARRAQRVRWGVGERESLLVNVGRLSPQKNQAVLLRALAALPRTHLVIAGEGELRPELEALRRELGLEGRVHLPGNVPSEDVAALLHAADGFVFPSVFEGMPLALIEAMAAGLPVVASDIESVREVAEGVALLVPADAPEALAEAVRRLQGEPELARRHAEASRARATDYTIARMAQRYLRLLEGRS